MNAGKIAVFGEEFDIKDWRVAISTFLDGIRQKTQSAQNDPKILFMKMEGPHGAFLEIRFDFEKSKFTFRGETIEEVGPDARKYGHGAVIPIVGNIAAQIVPALHELVTTNPNQLLISIFLDSDRRVAFWKDGEQLDFSATTAPTDFE